MSNNVGIVQLVTGQVNPEATANNAFGRFDAFLTEALSVSVASGDANVTTAQAQQAYRYSITGASVVGRKVDLPSVKGMKLVEAAIANTQDVKVARGSGFVMLEPGQAAFVIVDGTANGIRMLPITQGLAVPEGGDTNDVLSKDSSADGDFSWKPVTDIVDSPPLGGSTDDVLTKLSSADGDYDWAPGGVGGASAGIFPAPPPTLQRPIFTDFGTWVNQDGAVVSDLAYGFVLQKTGKANTDSLSLRYRDLPSGDRWQVTLGLTVNHMFQGNLAAGLAIYESSSTKLEMFGMGAPNNSGMATEKWSTPTGGRVTRRATADPCKTAFMRFIRGGNHYQTFVSFDGYNFVMWDEPILMLDFFTTAPNKWGVWINTNKSAPFWDVAAFAWHFEEPNNLDNVYPSATNYCNKFGSGDRDPGITVTTDAPLSAGAITELVDGVYLSGSLKFAADSAGNRHITFSFGQAVLITEVKFLMNSPSSQGTWKWQGSNDGSAWTDLNGGATFTLTGDFDGDVIGNLSANATTYSWLRMQQTAGSLTTTPTLRQIHFKTKV